MTEQDALFAAPPKLTPQQSTVRDELCERGQLTRDEAGELAHFIKGCRYCRRGSCQYRESDGRRILEALKKKGLAERKMPTYDGKRTEVYVVPGGKPRDPALARSPASEDDLPPGMTNDIPF